MSASAHPRVRGDVAITLTELRDRRMTPIPRRGGIVTVATAMSAIDGFGSALVDLRTDALGAVTIRSEASSGGPLGKLPAGAARYDPPLHAALLKAFEHALSVTLRPVPTRTERRERNRQQRAEERIFAELTAIDPVKGAWLRAASDRYDEMLKRSDALRRLESAHALGLVDDAGSQALRQQNDAYHPGAYRPNPRLSMIENAQALLDWLTRDLPAEPPTA